jgi:beta-N-acetylhexosaminidase
MNLATITSDLPHLEAVEWPPFRAAIASGVDAIMTAHLAVPALDDPGLPATLSPKILTGILRTEMGFEGLIVTDALEMGGIAHGFPVGDAAVRAIEAGADILLMPADPQVAINAVAAAVKSGRITTARIDESVLRLLKAKVKVGLAAQKLTDTTRIRDVVNSAESNKTAQANSDRSVTLVRNEREILPLKSTAQTAFYTMTEGAASVEGTAFSAGIRKRMPVARIIRTDSTMRASELSLALQDGSSADQYVIAAFASVAANRGTAALSGELPGLVQSLIGTGKPVIFIALGNPYQLRSFPGVAAYLTTYSTVPPSEVSAVKALFGEITVNGKLPVSIPGFAKPGDGLLLPQAER